MSEEKKPQSTEEFTVKDRRHWAEGEDAEPPHPEPAPGPEAAPEPEAAEDPGPGGAERMQFQAETAQLLELIIHSLYSNKEIFLRELISNASDAQDRLRHEALTDPTLQDETAPEIRLDPDPEARTLAIHDNGIGMSRQEVIDNIGTIAKSGTRELLSKLKKESEAAAEGADEQMLQLIGQFGVGFYSAFMVADRVTLVTRRAGQDEATRWDSRGDGVFLIEADERAGHGTSITLHLKTADEEDGLADFCDEHVLGGLVKKYSDFVRYPIVQEVTRQEVERDDEGKPKEGVEPKTIVEDRTLNSMKAIWLRRPQDVEPEEYNEFYKHVSYDWEDPQKTITLFAEGRLEYRALLFIPSKAPFDLYYQDARIGLQLYVNNVKIMDRCEELLPRYLRFVKGVVDSADLSLNVSRELLQKDRQITQIRRGLVKKVLATLTEMKDKDPDGYLAFWGAFGRALKEGTGEQQDKDQVVPLLLLSSSFEEELVSLADYAGRMKEDQEEIYYITGESLEVVKSSPHLEAFAEKGYEVLLLTDPVDELMVQAITEFEGKKLRSVGKGTVELGTKEEREEAEKARKESEEGHAPLLKLLQEKLSEQVKEVRLSSRLTSSPVCLVAGEHDMSPQLERLMKQARGEQGPLQKRILELNPGHPILEAMKTRFEADADDALLADYAQLLLGQALLAEGSELADPARFSKLVAELMVRAG